MCACWRRVPRRSGLQPASGTRSRDARRRCGSPQCVTRTWGSSETRTSPTGASMGACPDSSSPGGCRKPIFRSGWTPSGPKMCSSVLDATFVAHVVRPFSGRTTAEIVSAPRVYAFDTGFVCQHRGWRGLRREDLGGLFEHLVLNELHALLGSRRSIRYWRSKAGPEVDFVLESPGRTIAIECKWSAGSFEPGGGNPSGAATPAGSTSWWLRTWSGPSSGASARCASDSSA